VSQGEQPLTEVSTSDVSIGLLQGATAGSSDAIMDITPSTLDPVAPITITEESTLVKIDAVAPTELQMDNVSATGSSLMDMLSATDTPTPLVPELSITENVADAITIPEPMISLITPDTMIATPTIEATDVALETSLFSDSTTDEAILSAITPVPVDTNSPLHEMLREFIAKLEKLETESESLDAKTATAQAKLQNKRIKLEDEYHARLSAIESEQTHIMEGKLARQEEKTKLRKIIENLEKEIA
jgi:hypothetical protein